RRAPAHDVHVLARWRGSMADRGDTDRLAVVSMNDVAGRRTHRPWRSRATDARSPVSGAAGSDGQTVACAPARPRGLVHRWGGRWPALRPGSVVWFTFRAGAGARARSSPIRDPLV